MVKKTKGRGKTTKGNGKKKFKTMQMIRGAGFFGDLWEGIKSVGSTINNIAKKTGAVSKIAAAFGQPEIAAVSGALGYGKRRRKPQYGGMIGPPKIQQMVLKL